MLRFYQLVSRRTHCDNKYSLGRFSRGSAIAIMVMAPFWMPEVPSPATARPIMSIVDETATPQSNDPRRKMPKKLKNTHFNLDSVSDIIVIKWIGALTFVLK